MADTFSIDTGNPVMAQGGAESSAVMSQIQPNQPGAQTVAPATQVDTAMNQRTIDALLKMGSDMLQPQIKAVQAEQFMEGVQRASTGEAVKDIVESQPWYTQLFGPSSAVAGARGYTVATQVAQFGADMEAAMPELAQQGPEALTAKLNGFMKTVMTGDTAADMAITSQIVDQMAPLYKRQAKEHYIWQQKQANNAQQDAWTSAAKGLQSRFAAHAKDPTVVTQADVQAEGDRFLGLLNPFPGQSDESYEKNVARMVASAGDQGNFQVISLLKDRGIYDKISPELRTSLDGHLRGAATRTLSQLQGTPEFAEPMARLFYDMTQNPSTIPASIDRLNKAASKVSGVPPEYGQLISPANADNLMGRIATSQLHEATAQQKAADKLAADATAKARAFAMASSSQGVKPCIAIGKANGGCDADDAQQAVGAQFLGSATPAAAAATLNRNLGFTSDIAQRALKEPLNAAEYSPAMDRVAEVYANMTPETRGRYFTDDQVLLLDRYQVIRSGGAVKGEAAYANAKVLLPMGKSWLDKNEKMESAKTIRSVVEKKYENWVGWNQINDYDMNVVQGVLGESLKKYRDFGSMDSAVRISLERAEASGVIEKLGSRVIIGQQPSTMFKPFKDQMLQGKSSAGPVETGEAFEAVLAKHAEAANVDPDKTAILRMPDVGGEARFLVFGERDGRQTSFAITGQEVRAAIGTTRKTGQQVDALRRQLQDPDGDPYGILGNLSAAP